MTAMDWIQLLFRWTHVVAGVVWIGHLYFFNFVNAQVAKTYDADSKKKVVPELMPRALYWFRWGAMYTWVTGVLLAGMIYWMGDALVKKLPGNAPSPMGQMPLMLVSIALVLFGFFLYDALWKALAGKESAGVAISFLLLAALMGGLSRVMDGRALFIHLGALLGSIMMMNVWMRIWPAQRKIIGAIQQGSAPDAALVALAGLRSKQNTYMSVPLILSMVSNHYPGIYGESWGWIVLMVFVLLGWGVVKLMYGKSAGPEPARIG